MMGLLPCHLNVILSYLVSFVLISISFAHIFAMNYRVFCLVFGINWWDTPHFYISIGRAWTQAEPTIISTQVTAGARYQKSSAGGWWLHEK